MFEGFLKLKPKCENCGLDYAFADPADGPAFFVMMFLCIPAVAFPLWLELAYNPPTWVHLVTTLPLILLTCIPPLQPAQGLAGRLAIFPQGRGRPARSPGAAGEAGRLEPEAARSALRPDQPGEQAKSFRQSRPLRDRAERDPDGVRCRIVRAESPSAAITPSPASRARSINRSRSQCAGRGLPDMQGMRMGLHRRRQNLPRQQLPFGRLAPHAVQQVFRRLRS